MKKVFNAIGALSVLQGIVTISPLVTSYSVASATASAPDCALAQLSISIGKVVWSASINGTTAGWLPIEVKNIGGTCSLGGLPRITPVDSQANGPQASSAEVTSSKYRIMVVGSGTAEYTTLGFHWIDKSSSPASRSWAKSCAPIKSTGFTFSIEPKLNVRSRYVKFALAEVCTTVKGNLTASPLERKSNI